MRRTPLAAALVALALAFSALPANAADENPYYESKSSSPVDTMPGEWSTAGNGRSASLTIGGINAPGQTTHFEAGWVTPWSRDPLSAEVAYDIQALPTTTADLIVMERYREKGHRWSSWAKDDFSPPAGESGGGTWMELGTIAVAGGPPPMLQHEWKLVGDIEGSAKLKITAELALD